MVAVDIEDPIHPPIYLSDILFCVNVHLNTVVIVKVI
jgi:hypothetical protein